MTRYDRRPARIAAVPIHRSRRSALTHEEPSPEKTGAYSTSKQYPVHNSKWLGMISRKCVEGPRAKGNRSISAGRHRVSKIAEDETERGADEHGKGEGKPECARHFKA